MEKARLTQLTFEGLTLELTTIELGPEPAFGGRLERKVWSTSVLFEEPCNCAAQVGRPQRNGTLTAHTTTSANVCRPAASPASQVEEELIQMFSQERAPDRSQDLADIIGA